MRRLLALAATHPVRAAGLAVAAAAVFAASVTDPSGAAAAGGRWFLGHDGWLHAAGYAVLGLLAAATVGARRLGDVAVVVAIVAAYGAGIEVVQWFLPARRFELLDAAANAAGALVGAGAVAIGARLRERVDPGTRVDGETR